jgi:hypothetical protein
LVWKLILAKFDVSPETIQNLTNLLEVQSGTKKRREREKGGRWR